MIYVKSILAGIAAVLIALVLVIVSLAAWQSFLVVGTGSGGIGFVATAVSELPLLLAIVLVFSVGFSWQFRRSVAKRSRM